MNKTHDRINWNFYNSRLDDLAIESSAHQIPQNAEEFSGSILTILKSIHLKLNGEVNECSWCVIIISLYVCRCYNCTNSSPRNFHWEYGKISQLACCWYWVVLHTCKICIFELFLENKLIISARTKNLIYREKYQSIIQTRNFLFGLSAKKLNGIFALSFNCHWP